MCYHKWVASNIVFTSHDLLTSIWDDCRVNAAPGDAFGVELGFEDGGVITAAARAAADEVDCRGANSFCIGFGDSTGGSNSKLSVSSDGMLFSLPSFGRRD